MQKTKCFTDRCGALVVLCICLWLAASAKARAATLIVDTTADNAALTTCTAAPNDCSLRGAIAIAASGDNVTFDSVLFMMPRAVRLTSGEIIINKNLTVTGTGNVIINALNASRIFDISGSGVTVSLSAITITGGNAAIAGGGGGGGIRNTQSTLNLTDVIITSNTTSSGQGGGGILNNSGTVNLTNSTVSDNLSSGGGGGISQSSSTSSVLNVTGSTIISNTATAGQALGGGIGNSSLNGPFPSITITNSAIVGNAGGAAGGIFGNPTITNSTISGNRATFGVSAAGGGFRSAGGGVLTNVTVANNSSVNSGGGIEATTALIIRNSIVAGNTAPNNPDFNGSFTSQGNNLVQNRGTSTGYIASDLPDGTNPLLDVLNNNGGLSASHGFLPGSPAIDAGNNAFATGANDQRGAGFARIVGGAVDIGAFERQGATAASVTVGGQVLTEDGSSVSKAQVWVTNTQGGSCFVPTNPLGYYQFPAIPAGETYIFDVRHKRHSFQPQVVTVFEEMNDLNFNAAPKQ